MTEAQTAKRGWFERWRDQRRARRQQAIEPEYFRRERARGSGGAHPTPSAHQSGVSADGWIGFGGDGGGCGGGDGGGC
jgi:hypothetical protein